MNRFHVILLLLFLSFFVKSQNTVWFLNGDKMNIGNFSVDTTNLLITYKNKRNKERYINIDNVFSLTDSIGKEQIFYLPVRLEEDSDTFNVEQMRSFVQGEFDADNEHKARLAFASGIVTGVGGAFVFSGGLLFWSPIVPLSNGVIAGLAKPKKSKVIKLHPDRAEDEHYIMGYRESARGKRTGAAIKGGLIGLGLGILAGIIYVNVK